jgi:hypothetical protein
MYSILSSLFIVAMAVAVVVAVVVLAISHRNASGGRRGAMRYIEEMSSSEYDAMYGWGEYPERFWPEEIAKLREEYAADRLALKDFEDSLDDMMGITRLEGYRRHA